MVENDPTVTYAGLGDGSHSPYCVCNQCKPDRSNMQSHCRGNNWYNLKFGRESYNIYAVTAYTIYIYSRMDIGIYF